MMGSACITLYLPNVGLFEMKEVEEAVGAIVDARNLEATVSFEFESDKVRMPKFG